MEYVSSGQPTSLNVLLLEKGFSLPLLNMKLQLAAT